MKSKMPQYEYINMDSGWYVHDTVDEFGRWSYRRDLFPNGLRYLSDHLAKNGHKLGIYILPGIRKEAVENNAKIKGTTHYLKELTTRKLEGNGFKGTTYMPDEHNELVQMYYDSMAELFAEWGISFVKVDGCGPGGGDQFYPYQSPDNRECLRMMGQAFRKRNIWMQLSWYMDPSYISDWVKISNGARVFIDIESYSTKTMTSSHRVFQRVTYASRWAELDDVGVHNGFYIDLDVVLVGMVVNGKCIDGLDNDDVRLSYISFWALVSSVFCIGADPRMIPDKYLHWFNHPEMLMIHQSGIMAKPIGSGNAWLNRKQIWWKRLADGRIACGLFNTHVYPFFLGISREIKFKLSDMGIETAEIKDVWAGEQMGTYTGTYSVTLRAGQCQLLLITPK
ncbi:glycoside hydrolase superfamily [Radiomyces spectabilis]|uniref:glycoside hydrolase superfamily n=1 Tax=Radiomyces spectabilis TaxID=64574 RepID=UPI002220CECE|nr:glycoside hydrolase superfamily [Radiomyces spectabilis]KAI8374247.1 glycoside hydrolase superfamily [Radiomyces spectabilis]